MTDERTLKQHYDEAVKNKMAEVIIRWRKKLLDAARARTQ